MISRLLAKHSNRAVLMVMLSADLVLFAGGLPLERYSLSAAADKSSSVATILVLLLGNCVLIWMLGVALVSSTLLINRVVDRFSALALTAGDRERRR